MFYNSKFESCPIIINIYLLIELAIFLVMVDGEKIKLVSIVRFQYVEKMYDMRRICYKDKKGVYELSSIRRALINFSILSAS
jgi:hypothetical protein